MQFLEIDGLDELPGVHAGCAEITDLAHSHEIVEGLERLFDRRGGIISVNLVEVHVIGVEAAEGIVDGLQDGLAGEAALVGLVAVFVKDLGGEDDLIAPGKIMEGAAGDLFAVAAGIAIRRYPK